MGNSDLDFYINGISMADLELASLDLLNTKGELSSFLSLESNESALTLAFGLLFVCLLDSLLIPFSDDFDSSFSSSIF